MKRKNEPIVTLVLVLLLISLIFAKSDIGTPYEILARKATTSLERGIRFFHSLAIQGGYVYNYSLDLKEKWGEGKTDDYTIEVQPPGTPAVGLAFLRAYKVTGNTEFLKAAQDAGNALVRGQNELGGWEHKIYFNKPKGRTVSFDDDQTQTAVSFLMALDQEINNFEISKAVEKALNMMSSSQLDHGGWPHQYPRQNNYHDHATFNDEGINDCIRVMIEAHTYYKNEAYLKSINKAGWFLLISQLPPPQSGWAQQYNDYLQPAWARTYEPPSVCPSVTLRNINTLIDLYLYTGHSQYLEPIPDALNWVAEIRLPNGKWARFVELGTQKPMYYDRGRIRVNSMEELSIERRTGYGYENDLSLTLAEARLRFEKVSEIGRTKVLQQMNQPLSRDEAIKNLENLMDRVNTILTTQDNLGRWITKGDRFKKEVENKLWQGEYRVMDRISSARFNRNINTLCDFLELLKLLQ